jgi:hypothetical protein
MNSLILEFLNLVILDNLDILGILNCKIGISYNFGRLGVSCKWA